LLLLLLLLLPLSLLLLSPSANQSVRQVLCVLGEGEYSWLGVVKMHWPLGCPGVAM
jgi:hypothetical protein